MTLPCHIRRMEAVKEASAAKLAAGLRGMAGRRLVRVPSPEPIAIDLGPREPTSPEAMECGIRSIPEPSPRRYYDGSERTFRVSLPFVSLQHEELR
jgi:hypothetical protein